MPTVSPLRIFYSYVQKDESFREELELHLAALKRQGAIQEWSDRDIAAGHDLKAAVDDNLNRADIILLLVSADFLASAHAWEAEMTRALERYENGEARVIPIIVRPVNLEGVPFAGLPALPMGDRPIAKWTNRDEAWLDVARAIGRTIEEEARQRIYPLPPLLPPPEFIGRNKELEAIEKQLQTDEIRMFTIYGLFGIGKTRLAIEVARRLRRHFRDGVCPVILSGSDEESLVASDIRAALDAPETGGQSLETSLRAFLLDKDLLLVLDRFDTVRSDESVQLIHGLLDACPGLKVMITSREPIPIQYGYQAQLALEPIGTRQDDAGVEATDATISDAARLFTAFARSMGYAVDAERDMPVVESICSKIGGHPQTINLVAGWLIASPLDHIEAGLSEYLGLSASEDDPLRQAWNESFQRLGTDEQSVLSQLSPFRGPFTREAAANVVQTDGGSSYELFPVFKVLAERGFLEQETIADGRQTGRYWIFETIRQYAKEKLDSTQLQAVQQRHAAYFLALTEKAELEIEGERQVEWLGYVRDDYSNIRAALRRSAKAGQVELSLRLAGALGPYWYHRGDFTEARVWLKELLAASEGVAPAVRAKALDLAGIFASHQGDYVEAIESIEEAQRLFQVLDDSNATVQLPTSANFRSKEESVARCLKDLAWVTKEQRNFEEARKLCADSLERYRAVEDSLGIAQSTADLGLVLLHLGESQQAIGLLDESLDLRVRVVKQPSGLAMSRLYLGIALYRQGDRDRAVRELRTSMEIANSIGFRHGIALAAECLGMVALAAGSFRDAASYLLRSLRLRDQMGDREGVADSLEVLAEVAARLGHGELATQLLARADLGRQEIVWGNHSVTDEHSLIGIDLHLDEIREAAEAMPVTSTASLNGSIPTTAELLEAAMSLAVAG